tara:strand:+ start:3206 stop:4000 length:795 start_codon:yes stop_codon:yes gene_type:complete
MSIVHCNNNPVLCAYSGKLHKYNHHKSIYFLTFLEFIHKKPQKAKCSGGGYIGGQLGRMCTFVMNLKQDVISYFKAHYYDKFHKILSKYSIQKNYVLPWPDSKKIICIHVRLDDVSGHNDYNGAKASTIINDIINSDNIQNINKYNKKKHINTQRPISSEALDNVISKLVKKYPDKEIHIIKKGNFHKKYPDISNKYKLTIHENTEDYDLWLLIHSEILILSKSFFANMAGMLHKGSQVYVPVWGSSTSLGIRSKYNKTNWITY